MREVCAKCGEPCNAVVKTETRMVKGECWRKETLKCSACRFVDYDYDLLFPEGPMVEAQIDNAPGLVEEELCHASHGYGQSKIAQTSGGYAVSGRDRDLSQRKRVSQKIRPFGS